MDKIKALVIQHQDKLRYALLGCAGLAGFNCLTRPDFNFVLYLYIYYIWYIMTDDKEQQVKEKINCFFFLLFSWVIDLVWTIFWSGKWSHVKEFEQTAHILVVSLSWLGILLKCGIILVVGILDWHMIKSSLPSKLQEKLNPQYAEQNDEI